MTVVVTHTTPADSTFSSTGAAAWNADHALSGVGTMAEQNANAVAITGGTINNTTIGATTPSTGVFTTLTAQNETLKGTGQNLLLSSSDFANAVWGVVSANVTRTTTTIDFTNSFAYAYQAGVAAVVGVAYTFSVTLSSTNKTAIVIRLAGGITGASNQSLITLTSTPTRYSVTFVLPSGNSGFDVGFDNRVGAGGDGSLGSITVSNAQLEIGSTANTYIPTTTTAVYGTPTLSFSGVASIGLQSDGSLYETSAGTGNVRFYTNNIGQEQARVSHTASAVNYHQLTGSATGSGPIHSVAGSDTNIDMNLTTKGSGAVRFNTGGGLGFRVSEAFLTGTAVNYIDASGRQTGLGPILSVNGSDTNVRFNITSKGTEAVGIYTNLANQLQFNIAHTASAVNYMQATGQPAGFGPLFSSQGSDTNINMVYMSKGTGGHAFGTGGGSYTQQLFVSHTASAVNYVQVTGGSTGNSPSISWQGSDANIQAAYLSKGTGVHSFFSGLGARKLLQLSDVTSSVNFVEIIPSATGVGVRLIANGSDTNIPLVLQPKGTGALQAQQTDSTATGGNARGTNAVDWQTSRSAASQVASAQLSVIGGGTANTVTGPIAGILSGGFNTVSAQYAVVAGGAANAVTQYASGILAGQSNQALGYFNLIGGGFTNSATSGSAVTTQSGTMNATTAVTLSGSNANIKVGQLITGTSITSFTYVAAISGTSLTLSQAASGSSTSTLSFFTPHGVVVGGGNNTATGSYSFIGGGGDAGNTTNRNIASGDWSVVVGGARNTASGLGAAVVGGGIFTAGNYFPNTASATSSFVGGGTNNNASGTYSSIVGGLSNNTSGSQSFIYGGDGSVASGTASTILSGIKATTRGIIGNAVFGAGAPVALNLGAAQSGLLILNQETTNATATVLTSNTVGAGTQNQVILPNNSAYFFTGEVIAGVTGGGNTKGWTIEGVIKRGANAASTALVGTPTVTSTYADAGASTWVIAVTADTTNGGLAVTFTGQLATTIRTVCQIRTTEMTY